MRIFNNAGQIAFTAALTDTSGSAGVIQAIFRATPNSPPIADAGGDQDVIFKKAQSTDVMLDGSGSSDSDGTIVAYDWNDGQGHTSSAESPTFTLGEGVFLFTLTVTDDQGDQGAALATITVTKDRGKAQCNNPNSNKPECQSQ